MLGLVSVCFASCEGLFLCLGAGVGFPSCSSISLVWGLMSIGKVFKGELSSLDLLGLEDSLGRTLGWQVLDGLLLTSSSCSLDLGVWDLLGLRGLS